jgi:hypothetical protein
MLRDVVIHIANEQPVLADLVNAPAPSDVALICTNLRTMNGKKPVFIDKGDATFVFPIVHIRFVEVPKASMESHAAEVAAEEARHPHLRLPAPDGSVDGGALARLDWVTGDAGEAPVDEPAAPPEPPAPEPPPVNPDDLDPDLMRRIREA